MRASLISTFEVYGKDKQTNKNNKTKQKQNKQKQNTKQNETKHNKTKTLLLYWKLIY